MVNKEGLSIFQFNKNIIIIEVPYIYIPYSYIKEAIKDINLTLVSPF